MKKIILTALMILSVLTATVFAAEDETSQGYEYTSKTYGFKIACPAEPRVVVNPFEDPKKQGELLVFANDGMKILFCWTLSTIKKFPILIKPRKKF